MTNITTIIIIIIIIIIPIIIITIHSTTTTFVKIYKILFMQRGMRTRWYDTTCKKGVWKKVKKLGAIFVLHQDVATGFVKRN